MQLPEPIAQAVKPLFDHLPLECAMTALVVTAPAPVRAGQLVGEALRQGALKDRPALAAALWLYADDLDKSHKISQGIEDATGSFWHGIMHRREGDFSNSHYWFNKTGQHPAMAKIAGYDPHAFIDRVEKVHAQGQTPPELIDLQRREWETLFAWCAQEGATA